MTTRRYESPLGRDISLNKAAKGRGWKGLKGQMALALAVSLWIGGAGVAGATSITKDETVGEGTVSNGDNVTFWADNITLMIPNRKSVNNIGLDGHKGCRIVMEGNGSVGSENNSFFIALSLGQSSLSRAVRLSVIL